VPGSAVAAPGVGRGFELGLFYFFSFSLEWSGFVNEAGHSRRARDATVAQPRFSKAASAKDQGTAVACPGKPLVRATGGLGCGFLEPGHLRTASPIWISLSEGADVLADDALSFIFGHVVDHRRVIGEVPVVRDEGMSRPVDYTSSTVRTPRSLPFAAWRGRRSGSTSG